jgi:hypothetical protein
MQAIWWGLARLPGFWIKTPTEELLLRALHRHAQRLLSLEADAPFIEALRSQHTVLQCVHIVFLVEMDDFCIIKSSCIGCLSLTATCFFVVSLPLLF